MGSSGIQELYSEDQATLMELLIPALKNKVTISRDTMVPSLSVDLLRKNAKEKCLFLLLGYCVIEHAYKKDNGESGKGVSAATAKIALDLSKGQTDGVFYTLRHDKLIEQSGNKDRQVLYRIPPHRILDVMQLLKINDVKSDEGEKEIRTEQKKEEKTGYLDSDRDSEFATRGELDEIRRRLDKLEKALKYPTPSTKTKEESLREFLLRLNPGNDVEKTICIVYFMEIVKQISEGLNSSVVQEGFKAAKEKVPTNVSNNLSRCAEKGWIDEFKKEKGKVYWTITNSGMAFVEQLEE